MLKNHRNKLFVLLLASAICIPILLLDLSPKKEEPIVPQEPPINYEEKYQQASHSLSELQQYFNRATDILNKDKFTLESNYIPIVIYVYRRPYYLEKVLQALSQVKGIEKTILVVSHDSTMPEMLDLVRNISFCQVKQLFHPVSPVGRDSTSTTLKLHWYWLQNTLWADIFPNHNGDMVFLEEDHIVSPDFYETAKMLSSVKHHGIVANVSTIALGSYFIDNGSAATFVAFEGFMNTGYGFNRTIWQMIKANEYVFNTSHYDWDTSLAEGLMPLRLIPYKQISPHLTRICNIGSAGGLHTTQVMANLCEKGLYPISNGQVDWSELVLYELGDSPRENKNQFKDRLPVEICRGNTCFE